ncbi:hypothetical protein [Asticcacaulis sp. 201]|uniref:hypothetical protein n=1 Tax=Asticcacaulis sp. 201 TaxID=3028787 RepID=UPI002916F3E4|nr:hypothetical protein [Asticcacaulis sp. 201]MDV6329889.1 hypothetical protein [Asticcacaulis sp. 201]
MDASLKPVAKSGSYADLNNKPTLFGGNYADLSGKPTLFSGVYADLSGKPALGSAASKDVGVTGGVASFDDPCIGSSGGTFPNRRHGYVSGYYYPALRTVRQDTAYTVAANTLYASPVLIEKDMTIAALVLSVSSGVASTHGLVGIYSDNAGKPGNKLFEAPTAFNTGITADAVEVALSSNQTLVAGVYWAVTLFDGAPGIRGIGNGYVETAYLIGAGSAYNVLYVSGSAPSGYVQTASQTYSGGLPATFGGVSTRYGAATPAAILKVA